MTITFITEGGEYVARINYVHNADGSGGYTYTITFNGNPIRGSENELADSFEAAECAIRRLLAGRLCDE